MMGVLPVFAIMIVIVASTVMGALGLRISRNTSDFLVASRVVRPSVNALAICGEYLSAGTFLGLAGLVLTFGFDMLWYPVGYTAGYLALLVLVATPLRRFGAYTIPEFAEGRLASRGLRRLASVFVLVIGWLYLLPQMKGAGITLNAVAGAPYWVGVALVAGVITLSVAFGGMRGITYVQAFQYVVKLFAIAIPAIVLVVVWHGRDGAGLGAASVPRFTHAVTVNVRAATTIRVEESVSVTGRGTIGTRVLAAQPQLLPKGVHRVAARSKIRFPRNARIPHVVTLRATTGRNWSSPFGTPSRGRDHPQYFVVSLLVATFLGTMGLPHIVARFYTNPDGPATRRTILFVLALLGAYYVWPPLYGVIGRARTPELLMTGRTDAVVILLPGQLVGGLLGRALTALVAAGAFAAFLSTSSGLLISVAGAPSHDLFGGGVRRFRVATIFGGVVTFLLGLGAQRFEINVLVGWAFAIAASSFCPLLLLGVWWRRFTAPGAAAGLLVGGGLASAAIVTTMLGPRLRGWPGDLLAQPAAWSVPLAFAAAITVSRRTSGRIPLDVGRRFAVLHAPEALTRSGAPPGTGPHDPRR
jgi:Na+(H+)/acetate symporter ActP